MDTQGTATRAEIVSIFNRTNKLLDRIYDSDGEGISELDLDQEHVIRRDQSMDRAIEGLRFCVNAAAALEDPALFEIVADAIDVLVRRDDFVDGHRHVVAVALGALLSAGLEVDDRIAALARGPHPEMRAGIASGLDPRREPDRTLLAALVADPATEVRDAATHSMSAVAEVPWWSGKWASDPIARLRPEDGDGAARALRRMGEILDGPSYNLLGTGASHVRDALFTAIDGVPAALAVEALQSFCRAADPKHLARTTAMLHRMLALEGGEDALEPLLGPWAAGAPWDAPHGLAYVLRNAPAEMREAVRRRLLATVAAAPETERAQRTSGAGLAANVVALTGEGDRNADDEDA